MLLPKKLPPRAMPTTAVIASAAAALQVNEALAWIHGQKHLSPGEMLLLSLTPYSLSSFTMAAKQDCLAHERYSPSISIAANPNEITAGEVLNKISNSISLQLDFDVLGQWTCRNCGEEPVGRRLSAATHMELPCPYCSAERTPHLTHEIRMTDRLAAHSLMSLGIPPRSILRVMTDTGVIYVELIDKT